MSVAQNRLSLGRRQCDERRRYLAGLEALAQRLRADERRLRAELQCAGVDRPAPAGGADPPAVAGSFSGSLVERHSKLVRSVAEIDAQIAEVGAALGVAEQELKRREIASARHLAGAGHRSRAR
jgi:hypothetical protein